MIAVYFLDIPGIVSGAPGLVNEYYYTNAVKSFLLDVVLFACYLAIAMYFASIFKISPKNHALQLLAVAVVTFLISTFFMYFFLSNFDESLFFYRWFKTVQFKGVLYDVLIVCSVYLTMVGIHNRIE